MSKGSERVHMFQTAKERDHSLVKDRRVSYIQVLHSTKL